MRSITSGVLTRDSASEPTNGLPGANEEFFRALAAHTPVGIFVSDAYGSCQFVNERWCELAGLSPEQAFGDGWMRSLHPDDCERVRAEWRQAGQDGRASIVEYRFRRPDGGVSWIQGFAAPLRDADGQVAGWVGTCLDLTSRKQAEDGLLQASQRFRAAFDNAPIGMALVDPHGRFLQANGALCRLLGYRAEELVQRTQADVTHPDDAAVAGERRYVRSDGRVIWVAVSSTLVSDARGTPLYSVVQIEDVTERRRAEAELRRLADHDPLTGLLNRRAFDAAFAQAVARYRPERTGAVLLVDVDDFKLVNDTVGHACGDRLLVSLAGILTRMTRPGDLVGRFGGDEFIVLVDDASGERVSEIARRLIEAVDRLRFEDGGRSLECRVTIGACILDGSVPAETAYARADGALYQAKARGKHRALVWTADGESSELLSLASGWAVRIKDALRDGRLTYELQPVFDLDTRRIAFYEALVRILGDDDKLTLPSAFLPVAERFGLMPQIDGWMIEHVLGLLRARSGPLTVFVNLSATSLADDDLMRFARSELRDQRLGQSRLGFEVTERAAFSDPIAAEKALRELHDLGSPLALDDFGVDFSSFAHLRRLPVGLVKVGSPFVPRLETDPADRAIVRSIIQVCHALDRRVVVEHVESQPVARAVRELGAEFGQGFWWGPPASVALAFDRPREAAG